MSESLNTETVLASIAKLHAEFAELRIDMEAGFAEQGKSIAEQGKSIAELRVDMEAGFAEQGKSIAELSSDLKKNTHINGELNNKIGRLIESIVLPGIVDKFNEKGFNFDSVAANVKLLNAEETGNLTELDALLENGHFVIAIETKTDMHVSDVNAHIKRMNALRKHPRFKGKKIYGAFSTAIIRKKTVSYALEQGFYVLQQPDVLGIKILDFPKGCSAKAW
jgi:hypothetical protein